MAEKGIAMAGKRQTEYQNISREPWQLAAGGVRALAISRGLSGKCKWNEDL